MVLQEGRLNVVVFGGGTGLSTLLRGLKELPVNLTAIVTVADDGGSSGRLLQDYNIPPPGDIRQVMGALTDTGHMIDEMFQYRFENGEELKGHSLGNLMLAALTDLTGDFAGAIRHLSELFHLKGRVLPVANERMTLHAELEDGSIITGESKIPVYGSRIQKVYLSPQEVEPLKESLEAIQEADYILIGPGSLYTSIIPTLLVRKVKEAVIEAQAKKVYISNLTTQIGETVQYTASEHVQALYDHVGERFLHTVVLHEADYFDKISDAQLQEKRIRFVEHDMEALQHLGLHIARVNIASYRDGRIVHDPMKLGNWFKQFSYV